MYAYFLAFLIFRTSAELIVDEYSVAIEIPVSGVRNDEDYVGRQSGDGWEMGFAVGGFWLPARR